ncbi:unnamed protein product [Polarella glacialis]|uniref:Glucose-methanol-choline oxidoreductase N-terminal domain-containing protein n=1 Tax=Polarella glacialis TaxID=89957 RepID=A0A813HJ02_POLGL|nr:unnamed protein product [Polarella glacialis]
MPWMPFANASTLQASRSRIIGTTSCSLMAARRQAMRSRTPHRTWLISGAGFICAGDRYEIKQSMTVTFLRDAAAARIPAQFADRCKVSEVIHSKGVASGVRAAIIGSDGQPHQLTVRARVVVVACGSINSPALLLRSRLPNKNGLIGKNLRLHPVSFVIARVPAGAPDVVSWEGAPMTAVSNECARGPFGDNYGSKLECPGLHAGLGATGVAGLSKPGKHFKQELLNLRRMT